LRLFRREANRRHDIFIDRPTCQTKGMIKCFFLDADKKLYGVARNSYRTKRIIATNFLDLPEARLE